MLEVKHLTKHYGKIQSVSDVSFTIGPNEVVGLLGPNGAGKSTTMRMLTGYVAPTSGSVSILGQDVFENPIAARNHIGYLPELPPLYLAMTVEEQLGFVCDLRGIKKADKAAEILRVCKALHIDDVKKRVIKNLSKGYRQRVGFAGAIVGQPRLLILDEPTVGLDPKQMVEIRDLIQTLAASMTVIISSHILSEIASVCGRLLIMNKGRIAAKGTSEEIQQQFGGQAALSLTVRGDAEKAAGVLRDCVGEQARIEAGAGTDPGETAFVVYPLHNGDLREEIFRSFAAHAQELSLVVMRPLQKTLEDIFMEITHS